MEFNSDIYNKIRKRIRYRKAAQLLLEKINETYNNPDFKPASWAVYGGAGKKIYLKNE